MSDQDRPDYQGVLEKIMGKPSSTAAWTDEQWEQHDREVAAATADKPATGKIQDALEVLGWPRRALRYAIANPESALAKLSGDPRNGVHVLAGPTGVGKTVATAAWAMKSKIRPRFLRASSFAAIGRYNADQRSEIYSAQALVLDDLGAEFTDVKGSFLVDLDELVDTFYGEERTLLITTNLNRETFRARYSERIADRFRECAKWIAVTGDSMRKPTR